MTTAAVFGIAASIVATAVSGCSDHARTKATAEPRTASATVSAPLPSPSRPPTAAATTQAPPASHVANGIHTGDLGAFFLPVPPRAVPETDAHGETLDPLDVGDTTDRAVAAARLRKYGYRTGLGLTYTDVDVVVTIRLARFGSPAQAAGYFRKLHYTGSAIRPLTLTEPFPVTAQQTVPGAPFREVFATTYQGDVQMMVRVVSTSKAMPSGAKLTSLLEAQYQRLRTGR